MTIHPKSEDRSTDVHDGTSTLWTKGPWRVMAKATMNVETMSGDSVCSVFGYSGRPFEEHEANARLIAASPTMAEYIRKRAAAGDEEAARIWGSIHAS